MKKICLPLILLLLLCACQMKTHDLAFSGAGDNWSAKVMIHQTNGEETYEIHLRYTGNHLEEIDTFHYAVEGGIDVSTADATLNKEGVYVNKLLGANSPTTRVEDELFINIEWNDHSENFTLIGET
ncbi:hypothetical protein [Lysinibacillus sp. LZ02]|uniref:hypothetical protein n=1 Tax=Lysinibacillus sp. LZ02 TaxID=3420668 RepID=UPI003D36B4C9